MRAPDGLRSAGRQIIAAGGGDSSGEVRVASGAGRAQRERGADAYGIGAFSFSDLWATLEPREDLPKNPEKTVTAKADVVRSLKASFDTTLENYPKIDKQRAVKFLGHDATCEGALLPPPAHANEQLGQMIEYARVNGVVPPWSK